MARSIDIEAAALARFFSPGVMRELGTLGKSPMFARLVRESRIDVSQELQRTVAYLYERAFNILKQRNNRYEYVYKSALTEKILLGRHNLNTASMLSEFRVGTCKADIVIFNGTGTVYEIKTERDSLSRLRHQVQEYSKVFASVNVIVGENHIGEVTETVPHFVGIHKLSNRFQITQYQEPLVDASRTSSSAIFDAVTMREAKMIMKRRGIDVPDVPGMLRYDTWRGLFSDIRSEDAHQTMVEVLKQTRDLKPLLSLVRNVPKSLRFCVLVSRLKFSERDRLVDTLNTPIQQALCWR